MAIPTFSVRLVVVGGEFDLSQISLSGCMTFGRGRDVDIRVNHPLVSRRHCQLEMQDGQVVVRDLGSLNGTFVGNQRVEGTATLPPDGLLTVGTVTFRALYEAAGDGEPEQANSVTGTASRDTVADFEERATADDTVPHPGDRSATRQPSSSDKP